MSYSYLETNVEKMKELVEFFYNVSVVLGIDELGKVVGYCSLGMQGTK